MLRIIKGGAVTLRGLCLFLSLILLASCTRGLSTAAFKKASNSDFSPSPFAIPHPSEEGEGHGDSSEEDPNGRENNDEDSERTPNDGEENLIEGNPQEGETVFAPKPVELPLPRSIRVPQPIPLGQGGSEFTRETCFKRKKGNPTVIKDYKDSDHRGDCPRHVLIPNNVRRIGKNAFASKKLKSVVIPNTVITIRTLAFFNNFLTQIVIPDHMVLIGEFSFYGNALESLDIPGSVMSIGGGAFQSNFLDSVTFSEGIISIGAYAFDGNDIISVNFPESLRDIGDRAFSNNDLVSLSFSEGLELIGYGAFFKNRIASVVLPQSLIELGKKAFRRQRKQMKEATVLNNTLTIPRSAFDPNVQVTQGVTTRTW